MASFFSRYGKLLILVAALQLIGWGLLRSEQIVVLQKAATICLECIGVG